MKFSWRIVALVCFGILLIILWHVQSSVVTQCKSIAIMQNLSLRWSVVVLLPDFKAFLTCNSWDDQVQTIGCLHCISCDIILNKIFNNMCYSCMWWFWITNQICDNVVTDARYLVSNDSFVYCLLVVNFSIHTYFTLVFTKISGYIHVELPVFLQCIFMQVSIYFIVVYLWA